MLPYILSIYFSLKHKTLYKYKISIIQNRGKHFTIKMPFWIFNLAHS